MDFLTTDDLKAKTGEELIAYLQSLMAAKDQITEHQLAVKAELNSREMKAKFDAMPAAERTALVQYINAGDLKAQA